MNRNQERGIALVLSLFLMSAMSVLAASLMFLSQTETYASMNYRMMSQARYGGEAGVQKAADFLLDRNQYPMPTVDNVGDPLSNFETNHSPVLYNGEPVILSTNQTIKPYNYPAGSVQTNFAAAAKGELDAGNTKVNFETYATLISMQEFEAFGGTLNVVQTWEITGIGMLNNGRKATVEVMALVETPKVPANGMAAFATATTCGAIDLQGNTLTNSYDSRGMTGSTPPTLSNDGGDVGTNGNLNVAGHVQVNGNIYSPRTGVGTCAEGSVTAVSETGNVDVDPTRVVKLPTVVAYPPPAMPSPSPVAAAAISSAGTSATTCPLLGLTAGLNCNVVGDDIIVQGSNLSLPSVSISGHVNLVLVANSPPPEYFFNSIALAGGATIKARATSNTQAVLVSIVGKNPDNTDIPTPIDFVGGTYAGVDGCATCSAYDASMLQFVYGGNGTINLTGNNDAAATIYAPNAHLAMQGTADLYGSVLASTMTIPGTVDIHYDRRLGRDFYVAGRPLVGTFTWKRSE
jgi:hypothetical protein